MTRSEDSELLIGLDQGSSSTKGILYDPGIGKILAFERRRIKTRRGSRGGAMIVEHDPEEILVGARAIMKTLLKRAPKDRPVRAGIASQRSSFLIADSRTHRPMTPIFSWQDTRAYALADNLKTHARVIHDKTGLYLTPYYALSKILWLLKRDPGMRRKAESGKVYLAFIPTFLSVNLSEQITPACDATLAQRSLLLNATTGQWEPELLERLKIPERMLPVLMGTRSDYGPLSRRQLGRDVELTAMVGDQQAACLALRRPDRPMPALLNLGTGGFLMLPSPEGIRRAPGLLTGILQSHQGRNEYILEGTVTSISGIFSWLKSVGILRNSDRFTPPKPGDWTGIPLACGAFGGLASPYWKSDLRVNLTGLGRTTTRQQIIQGFLLGMAHLFWEILRCAQSSVAIPREILVSGGLSRNRGLLRILANYLDRELRPLAEADLTALGACGLASTSGNLKLPVGRENTVTPTPRDREFYAARRALAHEELERMLNKG